MNGLINHKGVNVKRVFLLTVLVWSAAKVLAAEPCMDNFSTSGNVIIGKTYKTNAVLSGINKQDAFSRAMAFTAENGFTVLKTDKDAGVISAAQSSSYGNGKIVPLNIIVAESGADTRINLNYTTPLGVLSPEDAIKKHFCLTVAAAGSGPKSTDATTANAPSAAAGPAQPIKRSAPRGFAQITSEQQKAIASEIPKVVPNENIRQIVKDATPTLTTYVERLSCLAEEAGLSALLEYAAPGARISYWNRGMAYVQYHNKAACMTITRIQGWNAPALNALQFEVTYKADDSGEIGKSQHEIVRQPDGAWLFTK